jgi:hypothetical protein
MAETQDEWTAYNFILGNPKGPGQGDVPALLRRVADAIEELGADADIQDVVFHPETGFGPVADDHQDARISVTVYYQRVAKDLASG